jgi:hypothetical protein
MNMPAQERDGRILAEWIVSGVRGQREIEKAAHEYADDYGIGYGEVWDVLANYAPDGAPEVEITA